MKTFRFKLVASAFAIGVAVAAMPAMAQATDGEEAASADEIVVTAQRRSTPIVAFSRWEVVRTAWIRQC